MTNLSSLFSLNEPMAPISNNELPLGPDWIYQIKWDGVRILAVIGNDGSIQLYSRKLLSKNSVYPEIVNALSKVADQLGPCILDGEVVYWDGDRPNFQKVLQRERIGGRAKKSERSSGVDSNQGKGQGLLYVLFDLLSDNDEDIRSMPFNERHDRLHAKLLPISSERLLTAESYTDGETLWQWVEQFHWEGIVSKRLSSPYQEGKKHRNWLKKKTALVLDVGIVGVKRRNGRVASLVMADHDGSFIGSVSLGLNEAQRLAIGNLLQLRNPDAPSWVMPFTSLPTELKGEDVVWLPSSLPCQVTGLELTASGLLRHPKIVTFGRSVPEGETDG